LPSESSPHSEHLAAFRDWAMADSNQRSDWLIERRQARELFEQADTLRETLRWFASERGFVTDEQAARVREVLNG
jgi:hypothetical protein